MTNQGIDRKSLLGIVLLSIAIPALVGYLIYKPQAVDATGPWVYVLPHINAAINATTSLLLLAGLYFIKNKQIGNHRNMMVAAFILGSIFMVSYVIYHASAPSTSFGGTGMIRPVYYFLLLSHILLAIVVVPLVLMALYFAVKDKIDRHRRVVKFAYPIWLYVSITGVIVYLMISPYYSF